MCWCIKIEYNKRRNVNLNYCYNVKKYLGKDCKGCLDVIAIIPLDVGKVTHVALGYGPCNVSSQDFVELPDSSIPFLSSDVFEAPTWPFPPAELHVCIQNSHLYICQNIEFRLEAYQVIACKDSMLL